MVGEGEESHISEALKAYWESLSPKVKELAKQARILSKIYSLLDANLKRHCVPVSLTEMLEKASKEKVLTLTVYADSPTSAMSVKTVLGKILEDIEKNERLKICDVRVIVRSRREIEEVRERLG